MQADRVDRRDPDGAVDALPGRLALAAILNGGFGVAQVVGGVLIGLTEVMTSGYEPDSLGDNFYAVAPYIAMILILLVRPYGLFGRAPAERL